LIKSKQIGHEIVVWLKRKMAEELFRGLSCLGGNGGGISKKMQNKLNEAGRRRRRRRRRRRAFWVCV
jgi:hypothetical protein